MNNKIKRGIVEELFDRFENLSGALEEFKEILEESDEDEASEACAVCSSLVDVILHVLVTQVGEG